MHIVLLVVVVRRPPTLARSRALAVPSSSPGVVVDIAAQLPPGAANNASGKHRLILQKKQATALDELCASCPPQFHEYLTYCRSLKFDAKPNMAYVRGLFKDLWNMHGYTNPNEWDWSRALHPPPETRGLAPPPQPQQVGVSGPSGGGGAMAAAAARSRLRCAGARPPRHDRARGL